MSNAKNLRTRTATQQPRTTNLRPRSVNFLYFRRGTAAAMALFAVA